MYTPGKAVKIQQAKSANIPIRMSGVFSEGTYNVTVDVEAREGKLVMKFIDTTGNYHREFWTPESWSHMCFRACMFPDLKAQKYIDQCDEESIVALYQGIKCEIRVEQAEGWRMIRDGDKYAIVDESNNIIHNWNDLESTRKKANLMKTPKAYHKVVEYKVDTEKTLRRVP